MKPMEVYGLLWTSVDFCGLPWTLLDFIIDFVWTPWTPWTHVDSVGHCKVLATKYYKQMDFTRAYVIAMFINPFIHTKWFEEHWDQYYTKNAIKSIKDLMKEYWRKAETLDNEDLEPLSSRSPSPKMTESDIFSEVEDVYDVDLIDVVLPTGC
ncbi:hypothetical protein BD779DRAFT_1681865 [Infundibulicybe gibba]|nr:hypothetical protein BD779DRAFT_1681865 [Infundibulicybe gibba]